MHLNEFCQWINLFVFLNADFSLTTHNNNRNALNEKWLTFIKTWNFVLLQSAFHDGKQPNWFHKACFFKKHRPQSEALIDGFSKLRMEDQKEIKEELGKILSFSNKSFVILTFPSWMFLNNFHCSLFRSWYDCRYSNIEKRKRQETKRRCRYIESNGNADKRFWHRVCKVESSNLCWLPHQNFERYLKKTNQNICISK